MTPGVGGCVWITFNPHPRPLKEFVGKVAVEMEQFQREDLRLVGADHRVIDCNWKVVVEAFHFRFIHDRGGFTLFDSKGGHHGLARRRQLPHGRPARPSRLPVYAVPPGRTKIRIYHYVPSSIEDTEELRVEQILGDYIATS